METPILTNIAPWLSIPNASKALAFYQSAFNAKEIYRLETPDGLVLKLSIHGAEFWISGNNGEAQDANYLPLHSDNIRMILTVNDPDSFFVKALEAGASQVFPVSEGHGWRLGRIVDPFGLHWEIGYPLAP